MERFAWQIVAFLVIAITFSLLELCFKAIKTKPLWRKDSFTDFLYWAINPALAKPVSMFCVSAIATVVLLTQGKVFHELNMNGFGPIPTQPTWLIVLEMVVISDLLLYWRHRLMHWHLWRLHSIHHSSRQVDWLSSARFHPIDQIFQSLTIMIPLFCLGFPLVAIGFYMPFISLYNYLLHSNLNWSFGPLKYIIADPVFHRWHHTLEDKGQNKNFCTLFPVLDMIFGTYYRPIDMVPEEFGVSTEVIPDGFLLQVAYPFKPKL